MCIHHIRQMGAIPFHIGRPMSPTACDATLQQASMSLEQTLTTVKGIEVREGEFHKGSEGRDVIFSS